MILDFHLKFIFDSNESEKKKEEVVENKIPIWGRNSMKGLKEEKRGSL